MNAKKEVSIDRAHFFLVLYADVVERFVKLGADIAEVDFVQLFLLRLFLRGQALGLFLFGELVYALQKIIFHFFT